MRIQMLAGAAQVTGALQLVALLASVGRTRGTDAYITLFSASQISLSVIVVGTLQPLILNRPNYSEWRPWIVGGIGANAVMLFGTASFLLLVHYPVSDVVSITAVLCASGTAAVVASVLGVHLAALGRPGSLASLTVLPNALASLAVVTAPTAPILFMCVGLFSGNGILCVTLRRSLRSAAAPNSGGAPPIHGDRATPRSEHTANPRVPTLRLRKARRRRARRAPVRARAAGAAGTGVPRRPGMVTHNSQTPEVRVFRRGDVLGLLTSSSVGAFGPFALQAVTATYPAGQATLLGFASRVAAGIVTVGVTAFANATTDWKRRSIRPLRMLAFACITGQGVAFVALAAVGVGRSAIYAATIAAVAFVLGAAAQACAARSLSMSGRYGAFRIMAVVSVPIYGLGVIGLTLGSRTAATYFTTVAAISVIAIFVFATALGWRREVGILLGAAGVTICVGAAKLLLAG